MDTYKQRYNVQQTDNHTRVTAGRQSGSGKTAQPYELIQIKRPKVEQGYKQQNITFEVGRYLQVILRRKTHTP